MTAISAQANVGIPAKIVSLSPAARRRMCRRASQIVDIINIVLTINDTAAPQTRGFWAARRRRPIPRIARHVSNCIRAALAVSAGDRGSADGVGRWRGGCLAEAA